MSISETRHSRRYQSVWWVFLLACGAGILVFQLLPDGIGRHFVYQIFGVASAMAMVAGVWMHRPAVPWAWLLMAGGQVLFSRRFAGSPTIGP
jgi:hypothetical protein